MEPFDSYPNGGQVLLGPLKGANARHEYGLRLQRLTNVHTCAYCGLNFIASYQSWTMLHVDHVVPRSVAILHGIPIETYNDMVNCVLSCSTCNTFDNRYTCAVAPIGEATLESFLVMRDAIFVDRKQRIAAVHEREKKFFDSRPWELPIEIA